MTQLSQVIAVTTASENEITIDVTKLSRVTMSRADDNLCMVTLAYKHGQGERNFRIHNDRAQGLQQWFNAHSATLQADHSTGISVWMAKSLEGGVNVGQMIDAMVGGRTPQDMEIEQRMATLFATGREVGFCDDFLMDFAPALRLMIKAVARAATIEELTRRKQALDAHLAKNDKRPAALPPDAHAILLEITTHGSDFLNALSFRIEHAKGEDADARTEDGHVLPPQLRNTNESYWRKQYACMERLIAMSRDGLSRNNVQVPE